MKSFAVFTLGCKVNSYESEAVKLLMLGRGYSYDEINPDIVIVNTCSVTSVSAKKSRQIIRRFVSNNPQVTIALMGCYSQLDGDLLKHLPNVQIVVGTLNRHLIPDLLTTFLETGIPQYEVGASPKSWTYEELEVTTYTDRTRAFVKIQDGCDNYCSYCIIPFARGRLRSRRKEDIFSEVKTLLDHGYHEIVLTGIHTAGYGADLDHYKFDNLIADLLNTFPHLYRLRISSIEASEITDRFLEMLATDSRLARHLHIPLQSGSSHILKRMNRHYSGDEFARIIQKIYEKVPDIAITTDIIVGFPGETEVEFMETYHLALNLAFAKIHVFPYSPRPGTASYQFEDEVSSDIKKDRVHRLLTLSNELEEKYAWRFEGAMLEIIIEQYNEHLHVFEGHSSNYLKGHIDTDKLTRGQIVAIKYRADGSSSKVEKYIR